MTRMLVNTKIALQKALEARLGEDREAGQGMLEYVGILVIAAVLIVAVMAALDIIDVGGIVNQRATEIQDGLSR